MGKRRGGVGEKEGEKRGMDKGWKSGCKGRGDRERGQWNGVRSDMKIAP